MNSPLEIHEVRLRGLHRGLPSPAAASRRSERHLIRGRNRRRAILLRAGFHASCRGFRAAFSPSQGEAHRGDRGALPICRRLVRSGSVSRCGRPDTHLSTAEAELTGSPDRVFLALARADSRIRSAGPVRGTPAAVARRVPKGRDRVVRHARARYRFSASSHGRRERRGMELDPRCASPWLGENADPGQAARSDAEPRVGAPSTCLSF